MALFYDQENDEGGSYEPQHMEAARKSGSPVNDLGHGPSCDHCNDATISHIERGLGRITNFKLGHLESKMDKGKWR